jgi:hypothetical protein
MADLESIEILSPQTPKPPSFVDAAPTASLIATFLIFIAFVVGHISSAARTPPFLQVSDEFFRLNHSLFTSLVEIPLAIDSVSPDHQAIQINCSLVRAQFESVQELPVVFSVHMQFENRSKPISTRVAHKRLSLPFANGSSQSAPFTLIGQGANSFTSVSLNVTIETDLHKLDGIAFRWSFGDPSGIRQFRIALCVISAFTICMAILYGTWSFKSEQFASAILPVLTILGIISCVPLNLVVGKRLIASLPNQFLGAIQAGVFRVFCLGQLDIVSTHSNRPHTVVIVALSIFFVIYSVFDASALYDRLLALEAQIDAPPSIHIFCLQLGYSVLSALLGILALVRADEYSRKRLAVFGAIVFVDLLAIWCEYAITISGQFALSTVPLILHMAVPLNGGAFAILLVSEADEKSEYARMDEDNGDQELCADEETSEEEETKEKPQ